MITRKEIIGEMPVLEAKYDIDGEVKTNERYYINGIHVSKAEYDRHFLRKEEDTYALQSWGNFSQIWFKRTLKKVLSKPFAK